MLVDKKQETEAEGKVNDSAETEKMKKKNTKMAPYPTCSKYSVLLHTLSPKTCDLCIM